MSGLVAMRVNGGTVHLLPVIKGLISEADKVKDAFDRVRPDKVAISLSREEVDGLRNLPDDFEPELSRYDEIYAKGLERFGEVAAPPPCYVAAVELADHLKIPLVPVDLDEDSFSELYCAAVTGPALFRHSTRTWLLKRRRFEAESAEDYVLRWDHAVNNMEGMRLIERKRAEAIAEGITGLASPECSLLAIVELERAGEVRAILTDRDPVQE
ncbi:MAG: hypothetical protein AB7S97_05760 [Thermoplasmata archaeon]